MSAELLLMGFLVVALGAVALTAIYSELRSRRFEPTPSRDRIFRCARCGFVYTDDPDVDLSRCPHCGRMNEAIEF